ncbi:MAG: hypothetical protein V7776_22120 [Halopseudomonas aestusnigri]
MYSRITSESSSQSSLESENIKGDSDSNDKKTLFKNALSKNPMNTKIETAPKLLSDNDTPSNSEHELHLEVSKLELETFINEMKDISSDNDTPSGSEHEPHAVLSGLEVLKNKFKDAGPPVSEFKAKMAQLKARNDGPAVSEFKAKMAQLKARDDDLPVSKFRARMDQLKEEARARGDSPFSANAAPSDNEMDQTGP